MSKIDVEILHAFKTLGVSDDTAEKAAVAFQGALAAEFSRVENRFDKLDADVAKLKTDIVEVKTTLRLHTWIIGANLTLSVAKLGLLAGLFELIVHKLGG